MLEVLQPNKKRATNKLDMTSSNLKATVATEARSLFHDAIEVKL